MPKITKETMRPKGKTPAVRDAWEMTDYMSVLLYGESGTGKTRTWSTFPGPILCIVCSGGKIPGELRSIKTKEMRAKITARVCTTGDQVQAQIEEAQGGGYETVVIDHGTGLQDLFLREEMGVEQLPQQKSWGMATKDHYQAMALKTKETFHRILSLPCNRVIVAQEKNHNEKYEGSDDILKPVIGGAFSKSVINWLNPACDYVLQTFKRPKFVRSEKRLESGKIIQKKERSEGVEYCLRIRPDEDGMCIIKFRTTDDDLPDAIVNPSYAKILELVQGE